MSFTKTKLGFYLVNSFLLFFTYVSSCWATCSQDDASHINQRANNYNAIISTASQRHGVSPSLIKAVITAESCFQEKAVSHKGAAGLMQLMPDTAKRFGVYDRFDPNENIDGGTRYLRFLLDRYNGSVAHAVAAYNAGEGRVDSYGVNVPFRETQTYTQRVINTYNKLTTNPQISYQRANFVAPNNTRNFYSVNRMVALPLIGQTSIKKIPPPQAIMQPIANTCDGKLTNHLLTNTQHRGSKNHHMYFYRVLANDTILSIASQFALPAEEIATLNHLTASSPLNNQSWLKIVECNGDFGREN